MKKEHIISHKGKQYKITKKEDCKDETLVNSYNFYYYWEEKDIWCELKNVQYMYDLLRMVGVISKEVKECD